MPLPGSNGTLIEAWASMKSFRPKDGGGEPPTPGRNGEPISRSIQIRRAAPARAGIEFSDDDGHRRCVRLRG
jgi:hypothetical protein